MNKKDIIIIILTILLILYIKSTFLGTLYSEVFIPKDLSKIERIVIESRKEYAGEYYSLINTTEKKEIKRYIQQLESGHYIFVPYSKLWDPADPNDFAIKIYSTDGLSILQLKKNSRVTVYNFSSDEKITYSIENYYIRGYEELYKLLQSMKQNLHK